MTLLLFAGTGLTFAGPGAAKAKSKLAKQVRQLVAFPGPGHAQDLNGEAVIFFRLNSAEEIEVKGVFGTNEALIAHVEEALEGQRIDAKGLPRDDEFQIRLKFNDLR